MEIIQPISGPVTVERITPCPGHHWPHRRLRRHCAPIARPDNTSAPRSSNTLETKRPLRGASHEPSPTFARRRPRPRSSRGAHPGSSPVPAQLRPLSDGRRQRPLQERPGRRPLRQLHPRRKRSRHRDRLHLHRAHRHHRTDGSRLLQRRPRQQASVHTSPHRQLRRRKLSASSPSAPIRSTSSKPAPTRPSTTASSPSASAAAARTSPAHGTSPTRAPTPSTASKPRSSTSSARTPA